MHCIPTEIFKKFPFVLKQMKDALVDCGHFQFSGKASLRRWTVDSFESHAARDLQRQSARNLKKKKKTIIKCRVQS